MCYILIRLTNGNLLQVENDKNEKIISYVKSLIRDLDMKNPENKDVALIHMNKPGQKNKEVGEIFNAIYRVIPETIAINSLSMNKIDKNQKFRKSSFIIIVTDDPKMVNDFHN